MQTRTATSAGGVILEPGDPPRVVLTGRRSFKGQLQWGLPKGLVEPGEERRDAAVREAREETGLDVEVVGELPVIDYWYVQPGPEPVRVHKFVHWYLMRPTGGDPLRHDAETEEVALLPPYEALARASFSSERQVIRAALEAAGVPVPPGPGGRRRTR